MQAYPFGLARSNEVWPLTTKALLFILAATALTCLGLGVWLYVQTQGKHSAQEALKNEQDAHANTRELHRLAALSAQAKATEQRTQYEKAAREANERHQALVEQAATFAVKNFIGRYGDPRQLGSGVRLPSALPGADSPGAGAPEGAGPLDGAGAQWLATEERFITDCAIDAATVEAFQQWCRDNHCEVID